MKFHVPLIVALLCGACGHSPTSPGATLQPPAGTTSMRGEVMDTIESADFRRARAGADRTTRGDCRVDSENGQFVMPWTPSDSATVRVSKEGFHAHQRAVPASVVALRFDLEAIDRPIIVAAMYQMTLTAADECTQLPNVARQRTYRSQVYPTSNVGWFTAQLLDGDFPYSSFVSAEVRGEPLHTLRVHVVTEPDWGNPVTTIVERIGPDMLLEFTGVADLPLGAESATAAFNGTIAFCAAGLASPDQAPNVCRVPPATCRSANHRLAWTRQ